MSKDDSYRTQIRRLRALAIETKSSRKYLLRICRDDYHSKAALNEELKWLSKLSREGLRVPKPVRSKHKSLVVRAKSKDFPAGRNCCLFEWIDGRFVDKSVRPDHLFQVGVLLAKFQNRAIAVKHRRYWTADGLVGLKPKFGSIAKLKDVRPSQQRLINKVRTIVYRKLRAYEKKFPERLSLIHADLHFGNIVVSRSKIAAIDFDDCGYGFHVSDLVVPIVSVEAILGPKGLHRLPKFKEALIAGYRTLGAWDEHDERLFPYAYTARRLMMLGWLNARRDNPRLRQHFKGALARVIRHLRNEY